MSWRDRDGGERCFERHGLSGRDRNPHDEHGSFDQTRSHRDWDDGFRRAERREEERQQEREREEHEERARQARAEEQRQIEEAEYWAETERQRAEEEEVPQSESIGEHKQ